MVYHFDAECFYLLRGTYTDYGGMASYPSNSQAERTEHKVMLFKRKRGRGTYTPLRNTPHLTIYTDSCYTYFGLIATVVHTRKLLY